MRVSRPSLIAALISLSIVAATPAAAGFGFDIADVRLACSGEAAQPVARAGNSAVLASVAAERNAICSLEIDYRAIGAASAREAPPQFYIEFMALGLSKAAFPSRHEFDAGSAAITLREGDGRLTLSVALATLFAEDRTQGAAITLGLRHGSGASAATLVSPSLFVERADRRPRRTLN